MHPRKQDVHTSKTLQKFCFMQIFPVIYPKYHYFSVQHISNEHSHVISQLLYADTLIQCDSFGTRPKKMRISQRLFIRFWTCIYDYIPCFMRSMSILLFRSDRLSKTNQFPVINRMWDIGKGGGKILMSSGQRLLAIWKSSTNLWINLMMTSSETAIFSMMKPHATPRMRAWPRSKAFLMTGLFRKPYGRQDLLT